MEAITYVHCLVIFRDGHAGPVPSSNDPSWQPSFPDGQPCSATRPCSLLQHPSWTKTCPPTAMLMATRHPSANSSRKPRHHPPATAAYPHPNCGLWIGHIWRLASIKTVSRPKSTVRGTHWTSRRKNVCGKKNRSGEYFPKLDPIQKAALRTGEGTRGRMYALKL